MKFLNFKISRFMFHAWLLMFFSGITEADASKGGEFRIGWATADITPDQPVFVTGQFHARVSEGVMDPVTVTALALESGAGVGLVMVSCDLSSIADAIRDRVRENLRRDLPELDPGSVFLFATHTHTGPLTAITARYRPDPEPVGNYYGVELDVMDPVEYVDWAAKRIADAVVEAWQARKPGGIAYGLGQAVVGRNRLMAYSSGRSQMYGNTARADFSHVEGYEDNSLNIVATYDADKLLTGMIINLACPSQFSESIYQISADFWHDTRLELRSRFGDDIYVLAQNSAAGDQSPRVLVDIPAENRMLQLAGRNRRQEIAVRIANGVAAALPFIEKQVDFNPVLKHSNKIIELPRRMVPEKDASAAESQAVAQRATYEKLLAELESDPTKREGKRWYTNITRAYRLMRRHERVVERFELQKTHPAFGFEVHTVRLGDVAFVSNPFEFYLDYGVQIKARSPAVQTFVIQLAGPGSYLPTERSVAGGAYGAVPASTEAGPDGGKLLVERSLELIKEFW